MIEFRSVQDVRADRLRQNYEAMQASYVGMLGEESAEPVAARNYLQGEYIVAGGRLLIAARNIPSGAALIDGVNVSETNVGEQLNALRERE